METGAGVKGHSICAPFRPHGSGRNPRYECEFAASATASAHGGEVCGRGAAATANNAHACGERALTRFAPFVPAWRRKRVWPFSMSRRPALGWTITGACTGGGDDLFCQFHIIVQVKRRAAIRADNVRASGGGALHGFGGAGAHHRAEFAGGGFLKGVGDHHRQLRRRTLSPLPRPRLASAGSLMVSTRMASAPPASSAAI